MYVRWQSRKRKSTFSYGRGGDVRWSAVLVENVRRDGKPRQQHIAYLVGFTESQAEILPQRCHLWDYISERLDQLGNRVAAADRKQIEAAIALKLPRPSRAEYKKQARHTAKAYGTKRLTKHQKAALGIA
jgi:hypothetical protein